MICFWIFVFVGFCRCIFYFWKYINDGVGVNIGFWGYVCMGFSNVKNILLVVNWIKVGVLNE